MYKKYVFLGLGGSGGKTLRFLKHELRKWLDENGAADRPMPDGWQFLHIDTPTVPDGLGVGGGINSLDQDEYLGLVGPGVGFNTVAQVLDSLPVMHDELQTWRVEPANLGISITDGAGQFRAVGKMISLAYLTTIKKRIQHGDRQCAWPELGYGFRHRVFTCWRHRRGFALSCIRPCSSNGTCCWRCVLRASLHTRGFYFPRSGNGSRNSTEQSCRYI
jgi:hypothetical protein